MKTTIYTFIVSTCLTMAATLTVNGQAGSLDPTFGTGGKVTTDFGNTDDYGYSTAIQSDGKIVVAGSSFNGSDYDFALVRYNSNGSLDNTFSSDGKVFTEFGGYNDLGYSVAIQSDGKIVVAGKSKNGSDDDFALVRYYSNGTLDNTFSSDGKVTTDFGGYNDLGYSVAIQSDDKIVVAGYSYNGSDLDFALLRYNTNGSLDNTFDSDGIVTTDFGNSDDRGYSVAIQSDGKIVVAGVGDNGTDYDFALSRYKSDGSLDNTFSSDGKVTTAIGSGEAGVHSVAIQSDGKIVVAGVGDNGYDVDFALVRYNSDGTLDNTFSFDGKVTTAIGSGVDEGRSVAIQNDGKILVAGVGDNGYDDDFALVRYNSDGSLDNTFGYYGKVTTPIGSSDDVGLSVAIQGDDKILVAGYSWNGSDDDFAVARYDAGPVGINEIATNNSISISPNPTTGNFQITFPTSIHQRTLLSITNLLGQKVFEEEIAAGASTQSFDFSNWQKGIYMVRLQSENGIGERKLVMQ